MKKNDFINEFAVNAGISKKDAREFMDVIQNLIYSHMIDEDGVKPFDGITIGRSWTNDRMGRNPQTGEPMLVPGHYKPIAKFGKVVKESVNK